jgi:hypothetical protein
MEGPDGTHHVADEGTGEVVAQQGKDGFPIWFRPKQPVEQDFSMIFHDEWRLLAKLKLPTSQMSVFLYMAGKLDFQNYVHISQKEIAKELDMAPSHVSAAIRALVDKGLLLRPDKENLKTLYRLPNSLLWRGNLVDLKKAKRDPSLRDLKIPREQVE